MYIVLRLMNAQFATTIPYVIFQYANGANTCTISCTAYQGNGCQRELLILKCFYIYSPTLRLIVLQFEMEIHFSGFYSTPSHQPLTMSKSQLDPEVFQDLYWLGIEVYKLVVFPSFRLFVNLTRNYHILSLASCLTSHRKYTKCFSGSGYLLQWLKMKYRHALHIYISVTSDDS